MKTLLLTFILTIIIRVVTAQSVIDSVTTRQSEIDSLEKQLASTRQDTNRVLILGDLSLRYLGLSNEIAMKYAQEGFALSRALKFRKGEADCLRRSGIVLFQQGRYPEALDISGTT